MTEQGTVRELTATEAELVSAWRDTKALARKHGDEESGLRTRVLDMLRDEDGGLPEQVYADGRLVLVVKLIDTSRTDTKALREAYPSVAAQFVTDSTQVRVTAP